MAFPYVPNYGGNWQTGAGGGTPITEAALDNLETQFASVIALLTTRGDIIYRGAATWERLVAGAAGTILEMGASDPAWGAAPARITTVDTEIFNAASPNPIAWTDLDLSAVVGANIALVLFRCYNSMAAGNFRAFSFRPNGEAEWATWATNTCISPFTCIVPGTGFGIAIGLTDAAGIVEWVYNQAAQAGVTIDVIGYIKRG